MDHLDPYLSVIVTSRNDNHGGTLLRRMQTFTNSFIAQCRRHGLSAELLIVEWNPPADRPPLADALRWPADTSPCQVRIIEVPLELHRRFRHSEALPLFQMIAKNVGIRRARGRFLLATNIDILFSDELMEFLARQELHSGAMYRIDRLDVSTEVPVDAPVPEQLAYCNSHYLRNNARLGTISLTPDGQPDYRTIIDADGVKLTDGWCGMEFCTKEPFTWATPGAVLEVSTPQDSALVLALEMEPGPSFKGDPFTLRVSDATGRLMALGKVSGRQQVCLKLPLEPGRTHHFHLDTEETPSPMKYDPRLLIFRLLRCRWETTMPPATPEQLAAWRNFAVREVGVLDENDLVSPERGVRFGNGWYGVDRSTDVSYRWASRDPILVVDPLPEAGRFLELELEPGPGVRDRPFNLHVVDARGRLAARARVTTRQRICLELPVGADASGWFQLHAVEGGRPTSDGVVLDFRLFAVERCTQDRRRRPPFRPGLFVAKWRGRFERRLWTPLVLAAKWSLRPVRRLIAPVLAGSSGPVKASAADSIAVQDHDPDALPPPASLGQERYTCPELIHTTACGDFTLLAREHWFNLCGYPELQIFSLHIDSLFCYMAHHGGAPEVTLEPPMRVYHIEHNVGSGATPEGINVLLEKIRARGITCLTGEQLMRYGIAMRSTGRPMIFNDENWGLANETLKETVIG